MEAVLRLLHLSWPSGRGVSIMWLWHCMSGPSSGWSLHCDAPGSGQCIGGVGRDSGAGHLCSVCFGSLNTKVPSTDRSLNTPTGYSVVSVLGAMRAAAPAGVSVRVSARPRAPRSPDVAFCSAQDL